jgi:integrase
MSTYDVRVFGILTNQNAKKTTYTVRWVVAGQRFRDTFTTKALAESFRSDLVSAQRKGVAFDEAIGLPEPMARELNTRTWFDHAIAFVDMKWPHASPKHRRSISEALATVTPALLNTDRGVPEVEQIRDLLYGWAFNKAARDAGEPPEHLRETLRWMQCHTVRVPQLADAAVIRKALDALALRLDGKAAAATTVARKRAVFSGALKYAVELRLLDTHPMTLLSWAAPKSNDEVDRRSVVNPVQARALLAKVHELSPRLHAFFACMYYSALRPEEVLHLKGDDFERPASPGGWGWFNLSGATVAVGQAWGDGDGTFEDRTLKHRPKRATRRVPVPPALVTILEGHLKAYGAGRDGRLFRTQTGNPIPSATYTRAWQTARNATFTEAQQRSPLAKVPYQLRHAAVSLWLNAGVPATQVAEWAGHSVHVLMKVYAKCLDGQEDAARLRVAAALSLDTAASDHAANAAADEEEQDGQDPGALPVPAQRGENADT